MLSPLWGQLMPLTRTGKALVYLLRDMFLTNQTAPLGSPRTAEPGPGSWTITDTGNNLSIVGGRLRSVNQSSDLFDPLLVGPGFTRTIGRTFLGKINSGALVAQGFSGWAISTSGGNAPLVHGIATFGSADVRYYPGTGSIQVNNDTVASLEFEFCLILRSSGAFLLIRLPNQTLWKLIFVDPNNSTSPMYPSFRRQATVNTQELDNLRVIDLATLDTRFSSDYGLAIARTPGAVADGTTFTHNKDCFIETTIPTFPTTAGEMRIVFRKIDASNYWALSFTYPDRVRRIIECVGGVETTRAASGAGGAAGQRLTLATDGAVIHSTISNSNNINYLTAATGLSATAGVVTVSGGFSAANMVIYDTYNSLPSV